MSVKRSVHVRRRVSPVLLLVASLAWATSASAQSTLFAGASDVTVEIGVEVIEANATFAVDIGGLATSTPALPPHGARVDALHVDVDDARLLSFDVTVELDGTTILPGDVARLESDGSVALVFEAASTGVGDVNVDAVSVVEGDLVLSFDTTVELYGVVADDADLVRVTGSTATLFWDSAAQGVADGLDLDGVDLAVDGSVLASFDTEGEVGGVQFADEDIVRFEGPNVTLWRSLAPSSSGWNGADLAAVDDFELDHALSLIFADGFEFGDTTAWD